ncbi:MAG: hypothetical protein OXC69_07250 [Candidatus Tectomicrobia bacterium]|nr:hypothetical protein [Candidatus Tectomicrobia bacterium]
MTPHEHKEFKQRLDDLEDTVESLAIEANKETTKLAIRRLAAHSIIIQLLLETLTRGQFNTLCAKFMDFRNKELNEAANKTPFHHNDRDVIIKNLAVLDEAGHILDKVRRRREK